MRRVVVGMAAAMGGFKALFRPSADSFYPAVPLFAKRAQTDVYRSLLDLGCLRSVFGNVQHLSADFPTFPKFAKMPD